MAVIRRFDRSDGGNRLLYVSAATMLGVDTSDAAEHSYTEVVDALRQHGAQPQADIEELWRRIAFSILVTNVDDHLHNHGFLHVRLGQWRLAPAFDVNPFPERVRELKTWISEDSGPEASIDALMAVAPYFRIERSAAIRILGEAERAVRRWREVGRSIGMDDRELDPFADAFEHRERKIASALVGG
ncbi:MAG: type II toxin-antitoxin system HipA family toxin [Rhodanobacter sp.]